MSWRQYIRQDNPVTAALLSQMGYSKEERVQVKKEFLRMLVRLQLNPAEQHMVTGFFEHYLTLDAKEENELRKEVEELEAAETEEIFRLENSWERRGRLAGEIVGKEKGLQQAAIRMLQQGVCEEDIVKYLGLPQEQVKHLKNISE